MALSDNPSRLWGRIALVMTALALGSAWIVGSGRDEVNENTALPPAPKIESVSDILDTRTYEQFNAQIRASASARKLFIPLIAQTGYDVVQRSMRLNVWQGSDGQLFFIEDFLCDRVGARNRFAQWAEQQPPISDSPLRFVVIADKSTVYADQLQPPYGPFSVTALNHCNQDTYSDFSKIATQAPDLVKMITPSAELAQRWDQETFYPGDTHWSPGAATAFGLEVAPWIQGQPNLRDVIQNNLHRSDLTRSYGDLFQLSGLPMSLSPFVPLVSLTLPGTQSTVETLPAPDPTKPRNRTITTGAPIKGSTLLLHDSFMEPAERSNTPLYEDLTQVAIAEAAQYLESTDRKFDRIVFASVMRNASLLFRDFTNQKSLYTSHLTVAAKQKLSNR